MLSKINSLPIVILSTPRTGSTALSLTLQKKLNGKLFHEPGDDPFELKRFLQYASKNNNYILKEHTERFLRLYTDFNLSKCTVIRTTRKDKISQIVSNYISEKRKKWYYSKEDTYYQDIPVELDEAFLEHIFTDVKIQDNISKNFKGKVDFDILYEDIMGEFDPIGKTIQPSNYQEILEWVTHKYKNLTYNSNNAKIYL